MNLKKELDFQKRQQELKLASDSSQYRQLDTMQWRIKWGIFNGIVNNSYTYEINTKRDYYKI